jgi:hypothetical protein
MQSFRLRALVIAAALLIVSGAAGAQLMPPAPPLPPPATDPQIQQIVSRISAARLREIDLRLVAFGTRSTFSEAAGPKRGIFAARDWVASQFRDIAKRSKGRMTVALDTYLQKADGRRIPRDVEISSVIATLHGDEPGTRTYVMSSHLDSRNSNNDDGVKDAPGADDNGSGTSAVLEAARALAETPVHATVIFATFDSEEQGLLGSAHFAKSLKDAGIDVEGDLNNDIVGASRGKDGVAHPNDLRIFSEALPLGSVVATVNSTGSDNDSPSRELARFAKDNGDLYAAPLEGHLIFRLDRFLRGGDHSSFNAQGFAALRFTEPVEDWDHQHQDVRVENGLQYGDLPQYMDFDFLAKVAQYNVANMAALALGPGLPKDAKLLNRDLTQDSTLQWTAVPGAAAYEIVRRLTTEPTWTHAHNVGNVTTATEIGLSKDNWLFGVRAVDAQGHRGVVAFPTPLRPSPAPSATPR